MGYAPSHIISIRPASGMGTRVSEESGKRPPHLAAYRASSVPLSRPCYPRRTQLATAALRFSVRLAPDGATTVQLIA